VVILISLSLALLIAFCLGTILMTDHIVFNFETNTVVELYDVTFDETSSFLYDVFECVDDKKKEDSIFIDKELQSFNSNKDDLCNLKL
jgi:hypothetical protein